MIYHPVFYVRLTRPTWFLPTCQTFSMPVLEANFLTHFRPISRYPIRPWRVNRPDHQSQIWANQNSHFYSQFSWIFIFFSSEKSRVIGTTIGKISCVSDREWAWDSERKIFEIKFFLDAWKKVLKTFCLKTIKKIKSRTKKGLFKISASWFNNQDSLKF